MRQKRPVQPTVLIAVAIGIAAAVPPMLTVTAQDQQDQQDQPEGFRFRSGIDLVNVTATVTDPSGRFVSGLTVDDFIVHDDGQPVEVTYFSAERVPVSLGIVLDTSGSMAGEKLANARSAIERFLEQLTDPEDEVFLYGFSNNVQLLQEWTASRNLVTSSLRRVRAAGGTAMYDAVAEAVPMAQGGRNRKKAVVLISDGNDTSSRASARDVAQAVRETEVLVYAIGIDGREEEQPIWSQPPLPPPRLPIPTPRFPMPGRGRPRTPWPSQQQRFPPFGTRVGGPLNAAALRDLTDNSGGRTEIVRESRDLDRATSNIADELSKQYYLGYPGPRDRDGRWHAIRVEVKDQTLRVRARRGYLATS